MRREHRRDQRYLTYTLRPSIAVLPFRNLSGTRTKLLR